MWEIRIHPDAENELFLLPPREVTAMLNAIRKLRIDGPGLAYPYSSAVRGAENLRELRPRTGRSAWRAFYRRVGDGFVVAAVGPEAEADKRGFKRAVAAAVTRLAEAKEGQS